MPLIEQSSPHLHVAAFAFPFGSHPRPLLSLVLKLATAAPQVHFSFFNTEKSNETLFSSSKSSQLPHNFRAYSVDDGVPAGHVLSGHPLEAVEFFLKAGAESFKKGIDIALAETGTNITCFLMDGFVVFAGEIAGDLGIPWIPVWCPLSCSLSAHFYTDLIRKLYANNGVVNESQNLDQIPGLSFMKIGDLPGELISPDLDKSIFAKTLSELGQVLPRATAIVINFFEELNPAALNDDHKSKFRKVFNVGFLTISLPLSPQPPPESDSTGCLSWLNGQKPKSVAYVSFGTVVATPQTELVAMAEALEESGVPFLWSLRDNLKEALPTGFVGRTSNMGKIVPWTPQTQVLAHESVGVFVTHGGCNSVFESIACGVPMICRPFFGDHQMTGRMVEDFWGIGVTVEGGVITKKGLIKNLELVLNDEQGKKMRETVEVLKQIVTDAGGPNGSAARDFQNLLELVST
ncbi:anthocyanidin 3-O-glucosyltransferase 7 [Tripterygium wilfordii]|uniref:Glycosyltransferase n=1 Tax=Tripterygium wilfordii TaxID=458696 RepID=A0A7J7CCK7_TRIWF|nr:anthocyanidin 3-O-glucosyltransferase 7-like [Tripterygium wilfordii]KAF5731904.1 anthocyanidin 3-O-glucosyltransferase 7 [Tripterygium wilfordii]